jgi:cytochrome P450 family 6
MQAKNLFNMEGQRWKEMRKKLSPTFTSGKMKNMYPLVEDCSKIFENYMRDHQGENIDMKVTLTILNFDSVSK